MRPAREVDHGSPKGNQIPDIVEVVAFQRFDGAGDVFFLIANFSGIDFTSYLVGIPATGTWHELVNSEDAICGGTGAINWSVGATAPSLHGQPAQVDVHVPPYSLMVFSQDSSVTLTTAAPGWALHR